MNIPERGTHTLDTLDALDFIMCGGLQGLPELLGRMFRTRRRANRLQTANIRASAQDYEVWFLWLRPQLSY